MSGWLLQSPRFRSLRSFRPMKRTRFSRRGGLTRDAEKLIVAARGLGNSGSRLEDSFWETQLFGLADRMLAAGNEDGLNAALDALYRDDGRGYEALADMVEASAESLQVDEDGKQWDVLMFAAPARAWSRFSIPAGTISGSALAALRVHLGAHVLASGSRFALANVLWSPDQLPNGFVETRELVQRLAASALKEHDLVVDPRELPETSPFLSDMRYVIGAVAVPRGEALFRWQEADGSRDSATTAWTSQGHAAMQALFSGCALEVLLPDAFHSACRQADRRARPYSIVSSVAFLESALEAKPSTLRAAIGGFWDKRLEEFRIGFSLAGETAVAHGVVWPLLDAEDENSDIPQQIEALLRECGVTDITVHDQRFPLEYCDDCGAPLYPDPDGMPAHAEMPEEEQPQPRHLH